MLVLEGVSSILTPLRVKLPHTSRATRMIPVRKRAAKILNNRNTRSTFKPLGVLVSTVKMQRCKEMQSYKGKTLQFGVLQFGVFSSPEIQKILEFMYPPYLG